MKGRCDFCCEEYDESEMDGTTVVGKYCIACHRLVIEESSDAIRRIKANKSFKKDAAKDRRTA